MARTIIEMLTSGDVIIIHPGKNWNFSITKGALDPEEFDVLLAYLLTSRLPPKKDPQ